MAQTDPRTAAPPKGGLVPYIQVEGAMKAADFYVKAFGGEIVGAQPPDEQGRTVHVHLYINGSSLMLNDPFPEYCHSQGTPAGFNLTLIVDDIDAAFARAVEAGCSVIMPVADMFWGDRYGQLRDPFGVTWAMNAPAR